MADANGQESLHLQHEAGKQPHLSIKELGTNNFAEFPPAKK
jgi:hypothetical protein